MSISLLDIWNFLINFNLLVLIPIFIVLFVVLHYIGDEIPDSWLITKIIVGTLFATIVYSILFLIFDVWLNWIDMPYPKKIIDWFSEVNNS